MTTAKRPVAVGSIIQNSDDLSGLPIHAVIMADPGGQDAREEERRLVLQLRADNGTEPNWFAAKGSAISAPGPDGNQDRSHYGPFIVVWMPSQIPAAS